MNVLIVGAGGREHALAWKAAQSPRLERLFVAPGNAGTAALGENVPIPAEATRDLVDFACQQSLDLVIIGPEAPLAAGLADALAAAGVPAFGPGHRAAEIESSKAFSKDFMRRRGLPTAAYATFSDYTAALRHLLRINFEQGGVVVKASGLAAGKGVIVPTCADEAEAALREVMVDGAFGDAGATVVIEERLAGEEVSLLAFTDGRTVRPMPPAQDHKRLRDGDEGPNTGGMGAYAPAPVCPPDLAAELARTVLQPTVDGLRAEGRPFVGVLYAGLMLTPAGPRVLEFNARFGDPEAEVLLPLLDADLLKVVSACVAGRLDQVDFGWRDGAAACVVVASAGYPGPYATGIPIAGLDHPLDNAALFHAGTRQVDGRVVTAGGRVLAATGWGDDLDTALQRAYEAAGAVHFDGAQFRRDIGRRARGVPR